MSDSNICPVCKNPKKVTESASLTQWIVQCSCDVKLDDDEAQKISVKICSNCNKRIDEGRAGSFTQYIFRVDTCSCSEPSPRFEKLSVPSPISDAAAFDESEGEAELRLSANLFPTDRYKPIKQLGEGAAGSVYLARDRLLNKKVAVKVLHKFTQEQLVAFQAEARATSQLKHPSIVQLLDFGVTSSETPYMVMEYIEGEALEKHLKKHKTMNWPTFKTTFEQIMDALYYAHTKDIFHRDLNLRNIILAKEDNVTLPKVIDFGLSVWKGRDKKDNSAGKAVGTPYYMSPDQGLGREFDARSETYSLACIMFECLTGHPPFEGNSAIQTLSMHASSLSPRLDEKTNIDFPDELEAFMAKALSKSPASRFQTMADMKAQLREIIFEDAKIPAEAKPETVAKRSHASTTIALFAVAAAVLMIILFSPLNIFTRPNPVDEKVIPKQKLNDERVTHENIVDEELKDQGIYGFKWNIEKDKVEAVEVEDSDFKELKEKLKEDVSELSIFGGSVRVTGVGLKHLIGHNLKIFLSVSHSFNDEGAYYLTKFPDLEKVNIRRSAALTNKGIEYIVSLPKLRQFELRFMNIPDNAFKIISKSKTIETVDLGHSKNVSLEDIKLLAGMPQLNDLRLAELPVNDKWMSVIADMKLKRLDINETRVTDIGLLKLSKMKTLQRLNVTADNGMTEAGFRSFRKKLPHCIVKAKAGLSINSLKF